MGRYKKNLPTVIENVNIDIVIRVKLEMNNIT